MEARVKPTVLLCIALAAMLVPPGVASAAPPPEGDATVTTPNVYLRDQVDEPWGQETNDEAMSQVFGDNWEEEFFQTVNTGTDPGGLFAASVRFIYLDGGDSGADELEAFLGAHEADLKAFTARGGRLFLNSAPNEGDGMSYDGRQLSYADPGTLSDAVGAADPSHPIFNGPFTPVTNEYTGGSFSHARWEGPGLTSLILGHQNNTATDPLDPSWIVLAEYRSACAGLTLLGGMTTTNFHQPATEALNLRANIISYAANTPIDLCAPTSASSGCVSATEVGVSVTDNPGGSGPASVRYTVDGGAEQTAPTGASGAARITVAGGQHTVVFRGADTAGNVEANPNSVTVTCQAPPRVDNARPTARIRRVPRKCVTGTFRVRITARDDQSLRRVTVLRDRRRLTRRTLHGVRRVSFTVRIRAARLRSGRHRIVVVAVDTAGNRKKVTKRFRRCARA